jgi:DNA primase
MPRIPDALIARLKSEVPLKKVVSAAGVELSRRGKDLVGVCPFHEDSEPSLVVTPGKHLWRCFGCGKGGSAIDFRMALSGEGFRAAVESLVAEHLPGVEMEEGEPAVEPFDEEELSRWLEASDEELLLRVAGYYRERLEADPRGRQYLEKRGLVHPELISSFELGFADRTLGLKLPVKQVRAGEAIRGRLMELGVLRKETGHEHLNGSLVVPVRDLSGRILQMYGRKVTPRLRKGTPEHLYLPGPRNCIFNPQALVASEELILAESILDALTFWCAGFTNVTCAFGVHGFTPALHEAMLAHGTRRVLVAYDRDQQGDRAAAELAEKLLADGIECYRVLFPRGMDANEYALKLTPPERSLDLALRQAEWMGKGRPPKSQAPALAPPAVEQGRAAPPLAARASVAPEAPMERQRADSKTAGGPAPTPAEAPSPASLLPAAPSGGLPVEVREQEVVMSVDDRRYRVRGLAKNLSFDVLRVNLLACRGDGFHVDTLDLYSARQRASFVKQAAHELAIDTKLAHQDLGRVLLELEALQEEEIRKALAPQARQVALSAQEKSEAMALLSDPELIDRILADFERCGVVGEEINKLLGYLAAVSRKDDKPLAVLVQSSSAAGKSALMEAILAFLPEEERVSYSAMTGQSLFYMGEKDLSHKVLAIAEEEGAERASYALKLLQSEGELSIASTGKDPATGRLTTHEYHVEGPVAILFTTTAIDLDEELLNRCLILTVDESREQTRAIHRMQRERETLEGQLEARRRGGIRKLHQNAQRLLEPLLVVNPFAGELSFPDGCTRTRRDHEKYLSLIRAVTLLHQHQRERKVKLEGGESVPYVEVTVEDLEIANRLAHEALGRTLDELPPQSRRLLLLLHELVDAECGALGVPRSEHRFTRRWVREATGWGDTQLKVHLSRLVDMEYLAAHRLGHAQRHLYELLYDGKGQDGRPFLPGLIDLSSLGYDENRSASSEHRSGANGNRSAPGRPPVGGWSGGGRIGLEQAAPTLSGRSAGDSAENAHPGHRENGASQSQSRRSERRLAAAAVGERT